MSNNTESKGVKRRDFLKVLGTAGAAVTTVGCSSEKVAKLIQIGRASCRERV